MSDGSWASTWSSPGSKPPPTITSVGAQDSAALGGGGLMGHAGYTPNG